MTQILFKKTYCLLLYAITFVLFSSGCGNGESKQFNDLDRLSWFIGEWKGEYNGRHIHEHWQKVNSKHFTGTGFFIEEGDTIITEKLGLEIRDKTIYYIADVLENTGAVEFKLIKLLPNYALFQNQEYDFPRRITYTFNEEDHLYVKIEGKIDGKKVKKEFFFISGKLPVR